MSWSEFEPKPKHPSRIMQLMDDYLSAMIAQLKEEKEDPSKRTPSDDAIGTAIIGEMLMSSDDDWETFL